MTRGNAATAPTTRAAALYRTVSAIATRRKILFMSFLLRSYVAPRYRCTLAVATVGIMTPIPSPRSEVFRATVVSTLTSWDLHDSTSRLNVPILALGFVGCQPFELLALDKRRRHLY